MYKNWPLLSQSFRWKLPKNHKFHSIFNRNNVKVSSSCTKNLKPLPTTIKRSSMNLKHTRKNAIILIKHMPNKPLNEEYQAKNFVCQASLKLKKRKYDEKYYKGIVKPLFKNLQNKRSKLITKCRNFNKLLLTNFEDNERIKWCWFDIGHMKNIVLFLCIANVFCDFGLLISSCTSQNTRYQFFV